jgi:hypothetical protein
MGFSRQFGKHQRSSRNRRLPVDLCLTGCLAKLAQEPAACLGFQLIQGDPDFDNCPTIQYFQGGPRGQGRILLEAAEIERIKELMRVRSQPFHPRRLPVRQDAYPGIAVPLGHPET